MRALLSACEMSWGENVVMSAFAALFLVAALTALWSAR